MTMDGDLYSYDDRLSVVIEILKEAAEADHEMCILRNGYRYVETEEERSLHTSSLEERSSFMYDQPQSLDTNSSEDKSVCMNDQTTSCFQQEIVDTYCHPIVRRSEMKMTRKSTAGVIKCSGCQKTILPNQSCSCPLGHKLCRFCVQKEVQDMLLGEKKARKLKCSIPRCQRYIPDEELCKVLSQFTIQLLEQKVDKEYLQYIKNWFLTSNSTKFQTREEFAISFPGPVEEPNIGKWPDYWVPMREGQPTTVFKIKQGSDEYAAQATAFHKSLMFPDYEIVAIYRIQNPILWKFYSLKRSQMVAENDNIDVCERRLYHGTVQPVVGIIAEKGFDWRLFGKNASVYGQGTYFAKSAFISHPYTFNSWNKNCLKCKISKRAAKDGAAQSQSLAIRPPHTSRSSTYQTEDAASVFVRDPSCKTHFMFAAHVLVGQFARGHSSYRRPPPINKFQPFGKLYDSCVDNLQDPEKFVIFDHTQAYPLYVIEYTAPKTLLAT